MLSLISAPDFKFAKDFSVVLELSKSEKKGPYCLLNSSSSTLQGCRVDTSLCCISMLEGEIRVFISSSRTFVAYRFRVAKVA